MNSTALASLISVGVVALVSLGTQWLAHIRERERLASEERRESQRVNETRLAHLRGVLDDAAVALTAAAIEFNAADQMNVILRQDDLAAAIVHARRIREDRGSDPIAALRRIQGDVC